MNTAKILVGDNRHSLDTLPEKSVQTIITSPPYWGLRDYGTATWTGGNQDCEHIADATKTKKFGNDAFNENRPSREETKTKGYFYEEVCLDCGAVKNDDQIGLEQTPEEYVAQLVEVFAKCWRVLSDDGTLWLNLGDSYAGNNSRASNNGRAGFGNEREGTFTKTGAGLKPKDLVGIPWRVAFALQQDGWYLRSEIIWHKPNPMPESVTDRPTKSHEHIFLLSKSQTYFYDAEAVKEPAIWANDDRNGKGRLTYEGKRQGKQGEGQESFVSITETRNKRDVWTVATRPFKGAHFATYPKKLIEPCVLAGSREDETVLDPFSGSGTTGIVAIQNGRNYIGLELSKEYASISEQRIYDEVGLMGSVEIINVNT